MERNARVNVTLHVCLTCRRGSDPDGDIRPGAALLAALQQAGPPEGVTIRGVECLSACDNGCNIALSAPGRWSYVYGHMDPDAHVADILAGAAAYAAAPDGIVPWRERPQIFRKQSLARIPPMEPAE
jgi:predicted metal-binding protein